MKLFFFIFISFFIYIENNENINNIIINGVFFIKSYSTNNYIKIKDNKIISYPKNPSYFHIIKYNFDSYYIYFPFYNNKILGVDENDKIILYEKINNININKIIWKIIEKNKNIYIIQNIFNNKFLIENQNVIKFLNIKKNNKNQFNENKIDNINILFNFFKIYEINKLNKRFFKFIEKEPIDIIIKYIDLTDKKLNRNGIKQIYKDKDNEELRYSLRSILYNIPWARKIFILMPNEKVKFLKEKEEINEKIVYIQDKQILGFDSANIQSFLFNLYKMENFGISKNFIYMEDDYFIGKNLKKKDFFYYDYIKKKVFPNVITWGFYDLNASQVIRQYNELIKYNSINAHSKIGFLIQRLNTEKFFIDNYKFPLINTLFTHNAISENIDDLKDMNQLAKKYIYFNETLFIKERNIFSLCHQHFLNLYQLNINKRQVNPIFSSYIAIEKIKTSKLNRPLFVINTGGNHIPLKMNYKIEKKIIEQKFSFKNIYEIKINGNTKNYLKIYFFLILKLLIIFKLIKIYIKIFF